MKKNAAWVAADGKGSVLYYGGPYLVVNRTYGLHKSLYIYIDFFFLTIFGPIYYSPPYY